MQSINVSNQFKIPRDSRLFLVILLRTAIGILCLYCFTSGKQQAKVVIRLKIMTIIDMMSPPMHLLFQRFQEIFPYYK